MLPTSWPTAAGYQMVPTLYAADAATAAAAGGFYNQTAFVPQLAITQVPQVYHIHSNFVTSLTDCTGPSSSIAEMTHFSQNCT